MHGQKVYLSTKNEWSFKYTWAKAIHQFLENYIISTCQQILIQSALLLLLIYWWKCISNTVVNDENIDMKKRTNIRIVENIIVIDMSMGVISELYSKSFCQPPMNNFFRVRTELFWISWFEVAKYLYTFLLYIFR